jgi:hypothetical protein
MRCHTNSEFPFLVGVVFAKLGDKPKLEEQIRKLQTYDFSGGVAGDMAYAMNIVPYRAFPQESSLRISRRLLLREAVLYDRISKLR